MLRGDTLCTHKGTHTTGSTLAPGYTDEGAPLPQFKTPFPECAPFLAATHSLGACPTLGGTTPAFTTGTLSWVLKKRKTLRFDISFNFETLATDIRTIHYISFFNSFKG